MKVKSLDKKLKNFISLSALIIIFFLIILIGFSYIYRYSTIATYNYLLIIMISVTILLTLIFVLSVISVFYTYLNKRVKPLFKGFVKIGLNIILPLVSSIMGILNINKDNIRSFYISVNNIIVQSGNYKYSPAEILVLLPHCLQDSLCEYKITNDIGNCRRCGNCCIGDIAEISKELGVFTAVATGGTVARKIVLNRRPKIILSVACERDLLSGIIEVRNIPVIGLINDRPNGPCYNTSIDAGVFKEKLKSILY